MKSMSHDQESERSRQEFTSSLTGEDMSPTPSSKVSKILISVVVPTYHRNDLLAKCLERLAPNVQSLLSDQYEVIVTDDGSELTAQDMIREKYPWARWIAGPRKGPAANRNNGAWHSEGSFIAFVDDDCIPSSDWLHSFAERINSDVFVYEGKTTCEQGIQSPMMEAPVNLNGGCLWSCNMMVQRELFLTLGGFDENFPYPAMEDADLHSRIVKKNFKVAFVEQALVDHPPRRSHWGAKYARLLQSHAYIWYKSGNRRSFVSGALIHIVLGRLLRIRKFPLTRDSASALTSWIAEIWYLIPRVRGWEKEYSTLFERSPSGQNTANNEAT